MDKKVKVAPHTRGQNPKSQNQVSTKTSTYDRTTLVPRATTTSVGEPRFTQIDRVAKEMIA